MSIHATRGAGSRRTSGGLNLDHPFATFSGWSWEDAAMCLVTMGLMAVLPAAAIFCGLMIWKDGVGEAPPKVDPRPRRTMLPRLYQQPDIHSGLVEGKTFVITHPSAAV